jgi:Fe-S-cluster containining protein
VRTAKTKAKVKATMREDPCTRCGACCAAFRVDFHHSELSTAAAGGVPGGVPAALTVPLTASLVRMRGTDEAPPRCIALAGEIGSAVRCTIYAGRPSPCRDFAPYAPLGIGDDACARARARHGLAPL